MAESGPASQQPPDAERGAPTQAVPPSTGILPVQVLRELLRVGEIATATPPIPGQIQHHPMPSAPAVVPPPAVMRAGYRADREQARSDGALVQRVS